MNYQVTLSNGHILFIEAKDVIQASELAEKKIRNSSLNSPYMPFNDAPFVLKVEIPDSMESETNHALSSLKEAVGGDIRLFVFDRLKYDSLEEMDKCFSAEQIDSIALAIYNIEAKNQGIIIGDQTGIGKGRQAAGIIRYAIVNGFNPIFLTEKPNLFSDLYRDLVDINSGGFIPFIVNNKSKDTHMRNESNEVVYSSEPGVVKQKIFNSSKLPKKFDYIVTTYSQFNTPSDWQIKGKSIKQEFLSQVGENNIFILDESHNTSGNSGIGLLLKSILYTAKGCVFLSATFAKRPDNMPIYGSKTAMQDAGLSAENLTAAIERGGVALQEVISSQLVKEGQMIRRQRTFEGVEVNYITLSENQKLHYAACNSLTSIMRQIIEFQKSYVTPAIKELDNASKLIGSDVTQKKGTSKAGVTNSPYFSKLFNVINQMLFTLKAEDVAKQAIKRLNQGMSVVIAFGNTMESFYNDYDLDTVINCDFSEVLKRGLDSIFKITTTDIMGVKTHSYLNPMELGVDVYEEYRTILENIQKVSIGFSASPIDVVTKILKDEGYKVGEVTGRKRYIQFDKSFVSGKILNRNLEPRKTTFQKFQDNEYDVLLINQAGSTGASAHAIPTEKISRNKVKRRCMIVLQAELDINKEVQKRGRIHRTGQIFKPIYDYVNSEIPAEKRLVMMLKSKLKSLDANTSSDQKNSEAILESPDFLNKIGDKIITTWLSENDEINKLLDNPLKIGDKQQSSKIIQGAALKVSGRIAILETSDQERFYSEVLSRYTKEVKRLKSTDEYDLEMTELNLQAKTLDKNILIGGKNSSSLFGGDVFIEKIEANNLKKPLSKSEIQLIISEKLGSSSPKQIQDKLIEEINHYYSTTIKDLGNKLNEELKDILNKGISSPIYRRLEKDNPNLSATKLFELFNNEVNKGIIAKQNNLENKLNSLKHNVLIVFEQLKIGQSVKYGPHNNSSRAIFTGFDIASSEKGNPFAPSKITANFIVASPVRSIGLPLSGDTGNEVRTISSTSKYIRQDYLTDWTEHIKLMSKNRHIRYVLTGNLLKAVGNVNNGNLINYSLEGGGNNKGLLLPLDFDITNVVQSNFISVPATKAKSVIKSISSGVVSVNEQDVYFYKKSNQLNFSVPLSGKKGAMYYKNTEILKCIKDGNFHSISSRMEAQIIDLDKLLLILENMGYSINMSKSSYITQFGSQPETKIEKWKVLKVEASKLLRKSNKLKKAKAIAVALKLKLALLKIA